MTIARTTDDECEPLPASPGSMVFGAKTTLGVSSLGHNTSNDHATGLHWRLSYFVGTLQNGFSIDVGIR